MTNRAKSKRVDPPDWLAGYALEEWIRVYPLVANDLDDGSMAVLASYCQNYGRWRSAEAVLNETGTEIVLRDDKGQVKAIIPSPQIGISTKYHDRMLKSAAMLGIVTHAGKGKQRTAHKGGTVGESLDGAFDVDAMLDAIN